MNLPKSFVALGLPGHSPYTPVYGYVPVGGVLVEGIQAGGYLGGGQVVQIFSGLGHDAFDNIRADRIVLSNNDVDKAFRQGHPIEEAEDDVQLLGFGYGAPIMAVPLVLGLELAGKDGPRPARPP